MLVRETTGNKSRNDYALAIMRCLQLLDEEFLRVRNSYRSDEDRCNGRMRGNDDNSCAGGQRPGSGNTVAGVKGRTGRRS